MGTILLSCSHQNPEKMTEMKSAAIINDVKRFFDTMTVYSENAHLQAFLNCYDDSPDFLAFSSDGIMRNYDELKKICSVYYTDLKHQSIRTIHEKFRVLDTNLVIVGWNGNIIAAFKNGDTMKMNNYSITYLFKKINNNWKVIHSHESSLPPEIIKKKD